MSDLNEKNNISRCWEYFNCSEQLKNNCEAFSFDKRTCWIINSLSGGPRLYNNGDCTECKWFKQNQELKSLKSTV
jgi:hypothetical protein